MIYSLNSIIQIGYQGENDAREIEIDIRPLVRAWPELTPVLLVKRPGENELYPVTSRTENGMMIWTPTAADTEKNGRGECVIHMIDSDGRVGKSRTMTTVIERSPAGDMHSEPPEAARPWVDEVLAAAQEMRAGYVPIDQGTENAGRLLYVRADGKLVPLTLGDGLVIENGVLRLSGTVTPGTQIIFEDAGGGVVNMTGAEFMVQADGAILISGATFTDQGGGVVMIN